MNAQQYILYTYPKVVPKLYEKPHEGETLEAQFEFDTEEMMNLLAQTCHAFGPDSQSVCEAAASQLNPENVGFMVLPLEVLQMNQSELSKKLDEQAKQRAEHAKELGGFT